VSGKFHLHLVSDSTGETINAVARACMVQFEGVELVEHAWTLVRTRGQVEKVLAAVAANPGVVLFTMVNESLRAAANGGPSGTRSSSTDPDTLVWVVAFTGSGFTPPKAYGPGPGSIGPPGTGTITPRATPRLWSWAIHVTPARAPFEWGCPCFGGPELTWPAWFDQLVDLDP